MTAHDPRAIRFRLTLPCLRLGLGPLAFDPVAQLLGVSVADVLASLLEAEPYRRPSATGTAVEVFPLALPAGEGAFVPVGSFGEVGLHNDGGLLAVTVPLGAAGWLRDRAGDLRVRGPKRRPSSDGSAMVAEVWLRLRPGARASVPLGLLGEMGLEAA